MTATELTSAVAEQTGKTKKDVSSILDAIGSVAKDALADHNDDVVLPHLGTFKAVWREQRSGRNPSTGEIISVPAGYAVKFKPGKELKDAVKG